MQFRLSAQVLASHTQSSGWPTTLRKCIILHAVVSKFLSKRGVQVHLLHPPCLQAWCTIEDKNWSLSCTDVALNLGSLLIPLQGKVTKKWFQFGLALGVEKEVLARSISEVSPRTEYCRSPWSLAEEGWRTAELGRDSQSFEANQFSPIGRGNWKYWY